MIRFGAMSIVLLCAGLYGLLRAAMLCALPVNRSANRLLAGLLLVLALYTAPYIIGYAGYYDAYPWLSFAPYNLTLAAGPLLYLYVRCLAAGGARMPAHWRRHLLPAALQLLYYCVLFAQPLAFKNDWDARVQQPVVDRIETLALLVSLSLYWLAAWRCSRLPALMPTPVHALWLRNLLAATGLTVAIWYALVACELATGGLSYFQRFPFYMWLGMLVAYLGTAGQQCGALPLAPGVVEPLPASLPETPAPAVAPAVAPALATPAVDYAALGAAWRATIIERQWWRDPELSLASLARQLGTNTTALSRAFNDGLGINFNEAINRLRIDAVLAAMAQDLTNAQPRPVLDIALAEGFNSKASFNRAFKLYTGQTPTEYRKQLGTSGDVAISS